MISFEVLSTGSKGNAVIVGKAVLIDCGVPYRIIEPHIRELKLVLLTHVHSDHFSPSTLRRMAAERPLLRFGACSWMIKPMVDDAAVIDGFKWLSKSYWQQIFNGGVLSFFILMQSVLLNLALKVLVCAVLSICSSIQTELARSVK